MSPPFLRRVASGWRAGDAEVDLEGGRWEPASEACSRPASFELSFFGLATAGASEDSSDVSLSIDIFSGSCDSWAGTVGAVPSQALGELTMAALRRHVCEQGLEWFETAGAQ